MSISTTNKKKIIWMFVSALALLICSAAIYFYVEHLSFWLPLINGATWPDNWKLIYKDSPKLFSFVLALRSFLNISPLFVVVLLAWELFVSRMERAMDVLNLLKLRDSAAEGLILAQLNLSEEQKQKIHEVFNQAGKYWSEEQLPRVIGKEAAQQFIKQTY